jgi:hypothetical protein
MPIPLPKPRHTVEKSENLIRVILPSKRNVFHILWASLWLFMWGYWVFALLYIAVGFNKAMEIGKNSTPPVEPGGVFTMASLFFVLFFLVMLGMGAYAIYHFLWLIAGKEVIEANSNLLRISRQTLVGKSTKEYSAADVKDLRVATQQQLFPFRGIQRLLGSDGMIVFDYGAKTFRFGVDLEEAEAKQISIALQEGLPPQNAG